MAPGDKKFSAQDVNRLVQKRLDRQKAKFADYDTLQHEHAAMKAELAKLKKAAASSSKSTGRRGDRKRAGDADGSEGRRGALRAKIRAAKKAGLPASMATRLKGSDDESLLRDAEKLKKSLGPGPKVGTGTNPPKGAKRPLTRADIKKMSPDEIIKNMDQIKAQLKDGSLNQA